MDNELLLHVTIKICTVLKSGGISVGTGFFFIYNIDEGEIPVIITNKHVIKNSVLGTLSFSIADDKGNWKKGEKKDIHIGNFEKQWLEHPDKDVDLCILPIATILEKTRNDNVNLYFKAFDERQIPSKEQLEDITAIEDLFMIGYPNGISDNYNNMPIVRKGITATSVNLNYMNKKEFLADIATFPGSSGSPVLLYNRGTFTVKSGIALGDRFYLMGIVYATMLSTVEGEIKTIEIPTVSKIISSTAIPNNLGIVIKAERILDFIPLIKEELRKELEITTV